ncbi:DUF3592 domain-containing protein [uncultured Azonexus sp.]|uniref:DUF3592 domain-containing protein n=1 Tax=uncultured Azonexus sp. TaxID=520307 RepID=UPI0026184209|nr:DUF3592 domain-containing protein [uncultured Azonexus sp.]
MEFSSSLLAMIGTVFIVIGLIFVPVAIRKIRTDRASRSWPQATATLERAEVMKHVIDRMHKENGPTQRISYSALLSYRYEINGQTYTAQHGEAADDTSHAARLAAAHRIGETRSIYYNPQAPEHYLIELEPSYSGLCWLLPALAFAGFGSLVIWVGGSAS